MVGSPANPNVPRDRASKIYLDALRTATWLLREPGSGTQEIVEQLLIHHPQHLRLDIAFGGSEAVKRATASGLDITCVSRCLVEDLLRLGEPVALDTGLPRITHRLHMVLYTRKPDTHGMSELRHHLHEPIRTDASHTRD